MTIGISMLQLLKEFTELPFGIYTVEIKKGENKTFWYITYTDYDGITITASEFIDAEDDFEYEIYNQTFMEKAFGFYNHELESQL